MDITEKRQVEKDVIIAVKCDICSTQVDSTDYEVPDTWHQFASSHNSWGDESWTSHKQYDVCSPKCFIAKLHSVVKELKTDTSPEIGDMKLPFLERLLEYINK